MKFAVTGGAGFIGSHIVKSLVSAGHDVTVIDDLSRGILSNLAGVVDAVRFENVSILDRGGLERGLRGVDGIFHHAAMAFIPTSYERGAEYEECNVTGSGNVFRIGLESGARVVYASSSTVYGNAPAVPISESAERRPINPYGATKLGAEILAEKYVGMGARIVGLRYFNVAGRGRRPEYAGIIPKFAERLKAGLPPVIYGDGMQVKDFVSVDDVVDATLGAMAGRVGDGFFNIGSGRATTVADLARTMTSMAGVDAEPQYSKQRRGDARYTVADISKARRLLGWRPKTPLEDMLREMLS